MRLLLVGYYGYRNWGDEGCLATLLQSLNPQSCTVLSGDPEFTRRTYGVRAVPRMTYRAVSQALREADGIVFGGGSLLQDATSMRSLLYYLTLIGAGLRARKPVWLVAQGMGPFQRPISRWLVRRVLNRLPEISLRDEGSAHLLKQIGVQTPLRVDADLTWALSPRKTNSPPPTDKVIGLAPRAWKSWQVEPAFVALARALQHAGYQPLLIPMQESQDRPLCERIAQQSGAVVMAPPDHPATLLANIAPLQAMVAMRLHGAIFALAQSVPTLCLAYDPKVNALAQQTQMPLIPSIDVEELLSAWQAFAPQIPHLRETLPERVRPLRQKTLHMLEHLAQQIGLGYNYK